MGEQTRDRGVEALGAAVLVGVAEQNYRFDRQLG